MEPLEERSIWGLKPWWCQPWSILLTGIVVVAASWWLLQRWWLSGLAALVVLAWWTIFLVLVPTAWKAEAMADRIADDQGEKP